MGRYELIRAGIDSLNGGQFQTLAQRYVTAKYGYQHPHYLGTKAGTEETTRGTPDAFWQIENGRFVFVESGHYTSSKASAKNKIKDDIRSCIDYEAQCDSAVFAEKIIICYDYGRFEPNDIEELKSVDKRVVLIGPDEIAEGLYRDFPGLAKEYLGLEFGSNQVMEPDSFVTEIERDAYAPSIQGELVGRESEMADLLKLIESSGIIAVTGKSGCGKTKLAFEVCKVYSRKSSASFLVIRSRRRSIHEDLQTYIGPGNEYVVLVDDADDMIGLQDLVDYVLVRKNVKVVLTVRNYAAEAVCNAAGRVSGFRRYELGQLGLDKLIRVARGQLDSHLRHMAERIVEVSRGNLRLVLLATQSVNERGVSSIRNMRQLLKICYDGKLELLAGVERKAAGIASVLGAHKIEGNVELEHFEQLAGVSHESYKAACVSLHEKELLDCIHGIAAVSFEEQNIRDYLIYDAICVSRWVTLVDIDSLTQDDYRMKRVLNILLEVFGDERTVDEVQRQLHAIWDNASPARRWDLAREFGPLFGPRALMIVVENLDGEDAVAFVWDESCFASHAQSSFYERSEMNVLESFFGTEYTKQAIDVLLRIAERRLASAGDLRKCFYELACSLKIDRNAGDLSEIESFVGRLKEWCLDDPDRVFCFLAFAEGVFDDQGIRARYLSYDGAVVLERAVISGAGMLDLRRACVEALRGWQGLPGMHQPIRDVLLGYRPGWIELTGYDAPAATVALLIEEFVPFFSPETVGDYEKMLELEELAGRCGLKADFVEERFCDCRPCEVMITMLDEDRHSIGRDDAIKELGVNLLADEYADLFRFFVKLGLGPHDSWWVSYSLKVMLRELGEVDPARLERVCRSYLDSGMHPDVAGQVVVHFMYGTLGAVGVRKWCEENARGSLATWLHLCNVEAINSGDAGQVAGYVLEEFDQADRPLYYEEICKCGIQCEGFMRKYYERVFEWAERNGRFPDWTLLYDPQGPRSSLREVAKEPENIHALEGAVVKLLEWEAVNPYGHTDYGLVGGLIEIDPAFAVRLARDATAVGACNALKAVGSAMRGIDASDERFLGVVRAIFGVGSSAVYCGRHRSLLRYLNSVMDGANRGSVLEWMAQQAVTDDDFGAFIREIARALDSESKKQFVVKACCKGLDVRALGGACCGMSFEGESWSGSRVPVLRSKIRLLEEIENELDDYGLIEHSLEIARLKDAIEQQIYAVEEDEFVRG